MEDDAAPGYQDGNTVLDRLSERERAARDAVGRDGFPLRAEFFSMMLGIPPQDLRKPVGALQGMQCITYDGNDIAVRSRATLLEHACECYRLQQMLPFITAPAGGA
jgi:hypothetical protein